MESARWQATGYALFECVGSLESVTQIGDDDVKTTEITRRQKRKNRDSLPFVRAGIQCYFKKGHEDMAAVRLETWRTRAAPLEWKVHLWPHTHTHTHTSENRASVFGGWLACDPERETLREKRARLAEKKRRAPTQINRCTRRRHGGRALEGALPRDRRFKLLQGAPAQAARVGQAVRRAGAPNRDSLEIIRDASRDLGLDDACPIETKCTSRGS